MDILALVVGLVAGQLRIIYEIAKNRPYLWRGPKWMMKMGPCNVKFLWFQLCPTAWAKYIRWIGNAGLIVSGWLSMVGAGPAFGFTLLFHDLFYHHVYCMSKKEVIRRLQDRLRRIHHERLYGESDLNEPSAGADEGRTDPRTPGDA